MSEDLQLSGKRYKHGREGFAILSVGKSGWIERLIYLADSREHADDEARLLAEASHDNLIVLPICSSYFRADAADLPVA